MESKFYALIFLIFFAGLAPARAQGPAQWPDSSSCTAQFFESYYGKQRVEHLEDGYRWEQILGMTAWRQDGGVQMLGAVPNADS